MGERTDSVFDCCEILRLVILGFNDFSPKNVLEKGAVQVEFIFMPIFLCPHTVVGFSDVRRHNSPQITVIETSTAQNKLLVIQN